MKLFKKLLFLMTLAAASVNAGTILIATTNENQPYMNQAQTNLYSEALNFVNSDPNYTPTDIVDERETLGSAGNPGHTSFSGHDLVIIGNAYYALTAAELAELQTAIQTNASKAFVNFRWVLWCRCNIWRLFY